MHGNIVLKYPEGAIEQRVSGKGVHIIVPHDWERNAVAPLIEVLRKNLDVRGVEMAQSRARILETSRKLHKARIGKEYDDVRGALFRLEDLLTRIADIERLLDANPGCAVVELHCMPNDHHKWDGFSLQDYYIKVNGTEIIIPKDTINGAFMIPLDSAFDRLKYQGKMLSGISGFFEALDIGAALASRNQYTSRPSLDKGRVGLIEVCAKPKRPFIQFLHSMKNDVWPRTDFEERHLTWESVPRKLNEKEVSAALSLFY